MESILNGITGGIVKLDEFKHHDIRKKRSPHIAIVTSVEYGNETIGNYVYFKRNTQFS